MSGMFDLSGKIALVTGGNSGIGLGMAEGLAKAGAAIAIWGTSGEKNETARTALAAHGGRVMADRVDVGDEAAVEAAMERLLEEFGRVDFVAANAGVGGGSDGFEAFDTKTWRRVMQVNLDGVFFTLRAAAKHMAARAKDGDAGGSMIVTSSVSAIHGAPKNQAYAATKGAVLAMVRGLAVEYGRYGIRANSVLPGWIRSDMTKPLQDWDAFEKKVIGRVPLRRWGEPEDFAGIAVYFASDVSRFHSGDTVVIDGAYSIF